MTDKDDLVTLTARVKQSTKTKLEKFCKGEVDGEKHIQEDIVEIAVNKHINYAEKLAAMATTQKVRKP